MDGAGGGKEGRVSCRSKIQVRIRTYVGTLSWHFLQIVSQNCVIRSLLHWSIAYPHHRTRKNTQSNKVSSKNFVHWGGLGYEGQHSFLAAPLLGVVEEWKFEIVQSASISFVDRQSKLACPDGIFIVTSWYDLSVHRKNAWQALWSWHAPWTSIPGYKKTKKWRSSFYSMISPN